MLYWGTQKMGLNGDESITFMQIKADGHSRITRQYEFYNVWHTAADLESFITINREDAFTYKRVAANGAHPPLYFYLMHTIYSFFPGVFTFWPGIILNLIFYIGALIVIYLLSRLFIKDRYLALLPSLIWGVSSTAIEMVVLLRMYMMLSFFCLLFTYIAYLTVTKEQNKIKYLIALAAAAFLGIMTHYYFLIFAFFISALICIYVLTKKKFLLLTGYVAAMISSFILFEIFGNRSITRLFSSNRGSESVDNLFSDTIDTTSRMEGYFDFMSSKLFGGISLWIILIIVFVLFVTVFIISKRKDTKIIPLLKNNKVVLWVISATACLFYILVIARTAPYGAFRYIVHLTPIIMLLFITLLIYTVRTVGINRIIAFSSIAIVFVSILVVNTKIDNLSSIAAQRHEDLSPYYNLPVISISDSGWHQDSSFQYLMRFENKLIFSLNEEWLTLNMEVVREMNFNEGLIVWIPRGSDIIPIYENLKESININNSQWVTDTGRHSIYYLH